MTKAKTIDRVELTRQKFNWGYRVDGVLRTPDGKIIEQHYGVSECPQCQQMTLIHDGGCEHCPSCGYSRCG